MRVLAYDYPLLGVLWTMLVFFIWIAFLMMLFKIIWDIFRSKDLGGFAKALWLIFVVLLPVLGALVYVIARGNKMAQRDLEQAQEQEAAFKQYVRETASGGTADELSKLAGLRDQGVITATEFEAQKAKILAGA